MSLVWGCDYLRFQWLKLEKGNRKWYLCTRIRGDGS